MEYFAGLVHLDGRDVCLRRRSRGISRLRAGDGIDA